MRTAVFNRTDLTSCPQQLLTVLSEFAIHLVYVALIHTVCSQDVGGHPAAVIQRRLGVRRERPLLVRTLSLCVDALTQGLICCLLTAGALGASLSSDIVLRLSVCCSSTFVSLVS